MNGSSILKRKPEDARWGSCLTIRPKGPHEAIAVIRAPQCSGRKKRESLCSESGHAGGADARHLQVWKDLVRTLEEAGKPSGRSRHLKATRRCTESFS